MIEIAGRHGYPRIANSGLHWRPRRLSNEDFPVIVMPAASDDNASEVSARAGSQRLLRIPFAVLIRIFNLRRLKAQPKSCFGQNLKR
jgi:hypothetical protein